MPFTFEFDNSMSNQVRDYMSFMAMKLLAQFQKSF